MQITSHMRQWRRNNRKKWRDAEKNDLRTNEGKTEESEIAKPQPAPPMETLIYHRHDKICG